MEKIIIIPDSFKGTLTSRQACAAMAQAVRERLPSAQVVEIPIADGGEGTVEAFIHAAGGRRVEVAVPGPMGQTVMAPIGLLPDGRRAVVEMASCAGLPLMEAGLRPMEASTYGVGVLLLEAARLGVGSIMLGLGGSATNDGGCGAASACGVRFLDRDGHAFVPTGGTLGRIESIDATAVDRSLDGVELTVMCDIDNPLLGPRGAARVFAPQKGATPRQVEMLEEGLAHLAQVIRRDMGLTVAELPGSGAAGGMGAGMVAFLGGRLQSGIDTLLDAADVESQLPGASLVLTGEGRIDGQSLGGKAVVGIARRVRPFGVPLVAVVGEIGQETEALYDAGITAIFSTCRQAIGLEHTRHRAADDLRRATDNLLRLRFSR